MIFTFSGCHHFSSQHAAMRRDSLEEFMSAANADCFRTFTFFDLARNVLPSSASCIPLSSVPVTKYILRFNGRLFPSVLWHCWLGNRKGIQPVKSRVVICWWWWFDWSFARLIAPVVTTNSIILSCNKIQNGDIQVSTNPGPPGKWLLKTEREREKSSMVELTNMWPCIFWKLTESRS